MSENYILYVIALLAVIIGFLIVKKVASCLIKTIVALVVLAVLGYIYYAYFYMA